MMFSVLMVFISRKSWQAQAARTATALIPAEYRHAL
jgi:hypothetical protein